MELQLVALAWMMWTFFNVSGDHVKHSDITYRKDGDLIIGGLFPVHETGPSGQRCGQLRETETLHRLEAMAWAINDFNNRSDILPGVELGFEIRDTCSDVSMTQIGALKFLPSEFTRDDVCPVQTKQNISEGSPIIGVVGTEMSKTTMSAAQLLGLNHIPVVSYYATSDDLSDMTQYPYFLRVVPPDRLQVQAMLEIIRTHGWSYIYLLYSDDNYGTNAYQEIVRGADDIGVCLAEAFEIGPHLTEEDFDDIVLDMQMRPQAKVVILFIHVEHANSFLAAVRRIGAVGEYQILGSDGWGMSIGEIEPLNRKGALGSLKTHLFSAHVQEFEDHFLKLTPTDSPENPWFGDYWNSSRNCSLIKHGASCLSSPGFSAGSAVSLVIDAVTTLALGLSEMHNDLCEGQPGICEAMMPLDTALLFDYMTNQSFKGQSGYVIFDSGGDAIGRYVIDNIQVKDGNYELVMVGLWSAIRGNLLIMNDSDVIWGPDDHRMNGTAPMSYCSDPCGIGQIYIPRENFCCWSCLNCSEDEITILNHTVCMECAKSAAPDDKRLTCIPVEAKYILWNNPLAIMLTVLAVGGLCLASMVLYLYVRNRQNLLIKASSRELCSIILVGIYLSYFLVFILITKPTFSSCLIARMMLMLSFTIIYAPILTRVNRIYRIFDRAQRSVRRPGCISPTSQATIAVILIGIQVLVNTIWLIIVPPAAIEVVVAPQQVELICNFPSEEIITSLSYNFILITLCSSYAVLTRKVPNNYNESRFIGLCVYTVLVIWIGFISSYFAINDSKLKVVVLSLAMICNGTITLCFMFLSKLYAIYFEKEVIINPTTYDGSVRGGTTGETSEGKQDIDVHVEEGAGCGDEKRGISKFRKAKVRPSGEGIQAKKSYGVASNEKTAKGRLNSPRDDRCSTISGSESSCS
ncbi:metabotropic glutamate receptor 2-like [Lytechinus pictus]|uniref:metabotropic glutamate receptor 2-like n=1 Tax=Lytechinus pictus TaxID=7653 RepID=UPI0030B9D3BA